MKVLAKYFRKSHLLDIKFPNQFVTYNIISVKINLMF